MSPKYIVGFYVLANAVFLLAMPLLPFIDLPNHLSEATIYKYYGESNNIISQFYKPVPWYFPNTFHTVFCSLFPSIEMGNKVFHILYIVLLQGSLYLVIKQLNGNHWFGLLGLLFTYNYNLTFGFVGFALAIPVIIILFYITLLDIKEDKIILKITISLLLIVLFLMHAQAALFGLLLYGLMMLYTYRHSFLKLVMRGILIPLPLVLLIFVWWFTREILKIPEEVSTAEFLLSYYRSEYIGIFLFRLGFIVVGDNFQLREGMAGNLIGTMIFSLVFIPLLYFKPWKNRSLRSFVSDEAAYALIFLLAGLGCYLLLPDRLPGQSPLFQRFCTIVIFSLIILGSIWMKDVRARSLKYFSAGVVICSTLLWFEYIYTFNRQNKNFTHEFFSDVDNHSRLAGLIYQDLFRGRKVYIHFPNYFLIWNKGIAASKIIDYRFGVVRRVASESVIPFYNEYIGLSYKHHPEYAPLEYILVRGKAPVTNDLNLINFSLVRQSGLWQLYKNKR